MSSSPIMIDAATVRRHLPYPALIAALRAAFVEGCEVPLRHRHALSESDSLLLMPAWSAASGGAAGVKIVSVFPGNNARGLAAVSSTYLLCEAATGRHLAVLDGGEITGRRTVGASALAADFLARPDSRRLLVVGAGHIAGLAAEAMAAVRGITEVRVWNHRPERRDALVLQLRAQGFHAEASDDLAQSAGWADIITCATLSTTPLIRGEWLRPGVHLDLMGGYTRQMRETDDAAIARASVFIDTDAALAEGGDITQPIDAGVLSRDAIRGDLAALCRGLATGRQDASEITLFKSVGSAIEDLAAARLAFAGAVVS
jgi:ornithine cyclodeaminase